MINDKACAVALLDELKKSKDLKIENQYIKNDIIFYKFSESNIAVSKKLNNIDLSILSREDWDFMLSVVNDEYISKYDYILKKSNEYMKLISDWSDSDSIISKMQKFINLDSFSRSGVVEIVRNLEKNKDYLSLLLNNRAKISRSYYYNGENHSIEIDVLIHKGQGQDGMLNRFDVIVNPTDYNISKIIESIGVGITADDPRFESNMVNKINFLLGMLIIKYNRDSNNESFKKYYETIYKINNGSLDIMSAYVSNIRNYDSFEKSFNNSLRNILNGGSMIGSMLLGYGSRMSWDIRNLAAGYVPNISIDYTRMTNEHLILFRDNVELLIKRHAKYITVDAKEREALILFLGLRVLDGKKRTREVLHTHLGLADMKLEIERRGL